MIQFRIVMDHIWSKINNFTLTDMKPSLLCFKNAVTDKL